MPMTDKELARKIESIGRGNGGAVVWTKEKRLATIEQALRKHRAEVLESERARIREGLDDLHVEHIDDEDAAWNSALNAARRVVAREAEEVAAWEDEKEKREQAEADNRELRARLEAVQKRVVEQFVHKDTYGWQCCLRCGIKTRIVAGEDVLRHGEGCLVAECVDVLARATQGQAGEEKA